MKRRVLIALAGLVVLVFLLRRQKGASLSHHEHNKETVRRFMEDSWNDDSVIDEVVSPDFVGYDPAMPEPIRGIQGAKDFLTMFKSAYPDAKVTVHDMIEDGDRVAARWSGEGTNEGELMGIPATGKQVTVSGLSFYRLSDGKIVEEWANWDALGMMVQLGVAQSPVSA